MASKLIVASAAQLRDLVFYAAGNRDSCPLATVRSFKSRGLICCG